jgi:hypothetical protein
MQTHPVRRGRPFWQDQYDQWQSTNLSKAAFCRESSLNVVTFYYWCKTFEPIGPALVPQASAFVPLSLTQGPTAAFSLEIADVTITCDQLVSAEQLRQWLTVIRSTR